MPWISIERKDDESEAAKPEARAEAPTTPSAGDAPAESVAGEAPAESGEATGQGRGRGRLIALVGAFVVVVAVGLGLGLFVAKRTTGLVGAGDASEPVALINGVPITAGDVERELAIQEAMKTQMGQQLATDPATVAAFKRDILDQLVDQQLMYQDALARGMDMTADQAKAELGQWTQGLDLDKLRSDIVAAGLTESDLDEWGRHQVILAHYLRDPAVQQMGVDQVKASGGQLRPADGSDVSEALEARADVKFRFDALDGKGDAAYVPMAKKGEEAPDFTLLTPDGAPITLSDFRGQPVLVNFWATWCGPCKVEMPLYVHVYDKNRDKGLVILGVNVQETADQVKSFQSQFGLDYPLALDEAGQVSTLYRVRGLPTTILVAPDGTIADTHRGAIVQRAALLDLVKQIMPDVGTD